MPSVENLDITRMINLNEQTGKCGEINLRISVRKVAQRINQENAVSNSFIARPT